MKKGKGILFGPVNSRRLGRSLGVDITPYKTCSYDCIYCELGKTTHLITDRRIFYPTREIHKQVEEFIKNSQSPDIDVITFAGCGEPALAQNLGEVIRWIKDITPIPVCVLTNSSLMWMEEVRDELCSADIVIPSIDSVMEKGFQKIDRPHKDLSLKAILDGVYKFSRVFNGRLFPEIMIVDGINDTKEEIDGIIEYMKRIKPDRIQLNVVDRYSTEEGTQSPSLDRMKEIQSRFPRDIPVDIVGHSPHIFALENRDFIEEKILSYLARRPAVPGDLASALGTNIDRIFPALNSLEEQGKIIEIPDRTDNYYYLNY